MSEKDSYPPNLGHRVVALLDSGDHRGAFALMKPVTGEALMRLNFELSALAAPAPGIISVGLAILVWGNPYRADNGHAWRCGDCPWTGSGYKLHSNAVKAAADHVKEHHANDDGPELCDVVPGNSAYVRMASLTLVH